MYSLRKWLYKPKKTDTSPLAQFFHADEDLNGVATELDSFDGRKDPERCTLLVNHLRYCQDRVLSVIQEIMSEAIPSNRANRDFRVKFPDDLLQDALGGQLWFGAECLAAGSSILNREVESASMRPLAKALTKSLDCVRTLLRDQCLKDQHVYSDKLKEALGTFDRLFGEFELSYVGVMVPVKTMKEYDIMQEVTVLFSETVRRALRLNLLTQDMLDDYDPALMFTIPRLAIICGLVIYPEGPLNPDKKTTDMSEMFRPFQPLLFKIRELLWTLSREELLKLEKSVCSAEEPGVYRNIPVQMTQETSCEENELSTSERVAESSAVLSSSPCSIHSGDSGVPSDSDEGKTKSQSTQTEKNSKTRRTSSDNSNNLCDIGLRTQQSTIECDVFQDIGAVGVNSAIRTHPLENEDIQVVQDSSELRSNTQHNLIGDVFELGAVGGSSEVQDIKVLCKDVITDIKDLSVQEATQTCHDIIDNIINQVVSVSDKRRVSRSRSTGSTLFSFNLPLPENPCITVDRTPPATTETAGFFSDQLSAASQTSTEQDEMVFTGSDGDNVQHSTTSQSTTSHFRRNLSSSSHNQRLFSRSVSLPQGTEGHGQILENQRNRSGNPAENSRIQRLRYSDSADRRDWDQESADTSDSSSFTSECHDDEIALAVQAAEASANKDARARFRDSSDLIHRLFVCISGVADQLQTNYASDFRKILKVVFDLHCSEPLVHIEVGEVASENTGQEVDDATGGDETEAFYSEDNEQEQEDEQETIIEEPPFWVPDEECIECTGCHASFTLVRRRHHCRNCGQIFCSRCSSNSVSLPHFGQTKAVRVCNSCYVFQVTPFTLEEDQS